MAVEKVEGIVIKTFEAGENSRRIKILCREHGIITVYAKGAKNTKSKLMSACQLFTYGEYVVYAKGDFYSLSQAEVKESFFEIRNDLKSLAYASYLAELTDKTVLEGIEADDVLRLIYMAYEVLAENKNEPSLVSAVFEIKYLQFSGLLAEDDFCTACGNVTNKKHFFSSESGGFICENCAKNIYDSVALSDGAYMAIHYVLENFGRKIFMFKVSDSVKKELVNIFENFTKLHLCDNLKTLKFAKECELM